MMCYEFFHVCPHGGISVDSAVILASFPFLEKGVSSKQERKIGMADPHTTMVPYLLFSEQRGVHDLRSG